MGFLFLRSAVPASVIIVAATSAFANPVIDPTGDAQDTFNVGGFIPDMTSVSMKMDGTTVTYTVIFDQTVFPPSDLAPNSIGGFVEIDTDQNGATGVGAGQNNFPGFDMITGFGSDVLIDLGSEISSPGLALIFDNVTFQFLGEATFSCVGDTCTAVFPQSIIGGQPVNFLTLVGSLSQPTDALSAPGTSGSNLGLCQGDANADGFVDIQDFIIWSAAKFTQFGDLNFDSNADFNGDMSVDVQDFLIWNSNKFCAVMPPPPCEGDINHDGVVNFVDLSAMRAAFFSAPGDSNFDADADFNSDGMVDVLDLGILKSNFFCGETIGGPGGGDSPTVEIMQVDNSAVGPGDDFSDSAFDGAFGSNAGTHYTFQFDTAPQTETPQVGAFTWGSGSMTINLTDPSVAVYIHPDALSPFEDGVSTGSNPAIQYTSQTLPTDPTCGDELLEVSTGGAITVAFGCFPAMEATTAQSTFNLTIESQALGTNGVAIVPIAEVSEGAGNVLGTIQLNILSPPFESPFTFDFAIMGAALTGDLNGDGFVNGADLANLLANFGPCAMPCPPSCGADLTGDCVVNGADLAQLLANWTG